MMVPDIGFKRAGRHYYAQFILLFTYAHQRIYFATGAQ